MLFVDEEDISTLHEKPANELLYNWKQDELHQFSNNAGMSPNYTFPDSDKQAMKSTLIPWGSCRQCARARKPSYAPATFGALYVFIFSRNLVPVLDSLQYGILIVKRAGPKGTGVTRS